MGCSGGDDGRNDAGNGGNAGNAGAAGVGPTGGTGGMQAGGSGGLGSGGTSGGGGNDPLDENNACGVGTAEAELTPVNMLIMFDRSGSMEDDDKWPNATAALTAFLQHPDAEGLKVALRFFPHDEPAEGCTEDGCDAAACEQPLVNIDTLLAESAPTDAHEERLVDAIEGAEPGGGNGGSGGTPIYAALDGALRWATSHKATTPDETTVVIFLTDGEPNGCDEDFDNISMLASDALASSGVPTYAIGLEGSSEDQMDQLAMAGGTNSGIFIGNSANAETELLAALNAIRGETLSCDFPMPEPMDTSMVIDPTRVNVTFTNGAGVAGTLRQVADAGACANGSAWYYDDMDAPTRIHLCPASCDTVRADPAGRLEILIGCSTCGGVDVDCGDGQVPPGGLPPVIPD